MKKGVKTGKHSHNYKGERVLATSGYYLIYVGKEHNLADVRGYAYEHRVIGQIKIGRKLRNREQIHHKDHNKLNNDIDNLEVGTPKIHRFWHRKSESGKRKPDQRNYFVKCKCGCGSKFLKFDPTNRPRKYISGHNNNLNKCQQK